MNGSEGPDESPVGRHEPEAGKHEPDAGNREPDTAQPRKTPQRRRGRRLLRIVTVLAGGTWLAGLLLWLTVRDRLPYLAIAFYALPLPVLSAAGLTVLIGLYRLQIRRGVLFLLLAILAGQVSFWLSTAVRPAARQPPADARRFVFWNVCRGCFDYDDVARELAATDADVIALVESTREAEFPAFWTSRLPEYTGRRLGSGMMILCRGEVLSVQPGHVPSSFPNSPVCRYRIIRLRVRGEELQLILTDIKAHLLMSRRPAFEKLIKLCREHSHAPLILAGDFNTPIESAWIEPMRDHLRNAFEVAGEGYRETWPVPFPVLCIDQVWGNARVEWHRCRTGWSLNSDHRPIVAAFDLEP